MFLGILLATIATTAAAQGPAPAVLVGVITSLSGEARGAGASQALAAEGWEDAAAAGGGVFGLSVDVRVVDDAGSPARAVWAARDLVDAGALVIVCCTTPVATAEVSAVAEELGVLHLAVSSTSTGSFETSTAQYWSFGLWPSETDQLSALVADALTAGRGSVALMTSDDEFGDETLRTLESLLGYAGMQLSGVERYPQGTTELRPEALLIASEQPGAVVVWGTGPDTRVAVSALRARGYEGLVYARALLVATGPGRRLPAATFEDVRFPLPPAYAGTAPPTHACASAIASVLERIEQLYGGVSDLPAAAIVVDALDIVAAALEQLFLLQIPPDAPVPVVRQALRDAAVGLGPRCASVGLLDLQEGRRSAVTPSSLVAPELTLSGDLRLP